MVAMPMEARRSSLDALLPVFVGAVLYVLMLGLGNQLLKDGDTYWHLVVGDWILKHGFPTTDPFSYTFEGKPWIAKEWGSQLLYLAAWRMFGWTGIVVISSDCMAACNSLESYCLPSLNIVTVFSMS